MNKLNLAHLLHVLERACYTCGPELQPHFDMLYRQAARLHARLGFEGAADAL
ncbi:MAG: hypothetical protein V2A77_09135 [Pseudomonadota bacterium]